MKRNRLNIPILKVTQAVLIVFASIYSGNNEARAFAPSPGDPRVGIVFYCDDPESQGIEDLVDTIFNDGRFAEVAALNGGILNPSGEALKDSFDCVLAYTLDGRDCPIDRETLFAQASESLADYVNLGGSLVIGSFSFSLAESLGLGPAIFAPGLSPFQRIEGGNGNAGPVDIDGASKSPLACGRILEGVGPFSITSDNVVSLSQGASLCASYDNGELFLAVNEIGNVLGLNAFPASENDLAQESYQTFMSNLMFEACSFKESAPIPTLSEWGLLAMAVVLGAIGLLSVRRRNAAAKG